MNKYITKVELPYIPKGSELEYDEQRGQYYVTANGALEKYQWYNKEIVEDINSKFFTIHPDYEEELKINKAMAELGLKLDVDSMMEVAKFLKKYNQNITKYCKEQEATIMWWSVVNSNPIFLEAIIESLSSSVFNNCIKDKTIIPVYLDIKSEIRQWFYDRSGKDIVINV